MTAVNSTDPLNPLSTLMGKDCFRNKKPRRIYVPVKPRVKRNLEFMEKLMLEKEAFLHNRWKDDSDRVLRYRENISQRYLNDASL